MAASSQQRRVCVLCDGQFYCSLMFRACCIPPQTCQLHLQCTRFTVYMQNRVETLPKKTSLAMHQTPPKLLVLACVQCGAIKPQIIHGRIDATQRIKPAIACQAGAAQRILCHEAPQHRLQAPLPCIMGCPRLCSEEFGCLGTCTYLR